MSYRDRLPHEIPLPDDDDANMNLNGETKETATDDKEEQKDFDNDSEDGSEDELLENEYMEELDTGIFVSVHLM